MRRQEWVSGTMRLRLEHRKYSSGARFRALLSGQFRFFHVIVDMHVQCIPIIEQSGRRMVTCNTRRSSSSTTP